MGCAAALVFACLGAAYGTAKSGVGVANMGVLHAEMVMKSIIPIIMAGVLGIYGLIVAVLLTSSITGDAPYSYASYSGYSALSAGLCCVWPASLPVLLSASSVTPVSAPTLASQSSSSVLSSSSFSLRLSVCMVSLLRSSFLATP